jgi:hypothetical protein
VLWVAAGGPGSIGNKLEVQVRLTGASGTFVCVFQTALCFFDASGMWVQMWR